MPRYSLICLFLLLTFGQVHAQSGSAAADRYLSKANLFYNEKKLRKAENFYKKAIAAAPHTSYAYSVLGKYYFDQGRYLDAAYIFESGTKSCPGGTQLFAIPWAQALFRAGNAERAGAALRSYQMPANAKPQLKAEVAALQRSIDFGRLVGYNKHNVAVVNMGDSLNSADDDYCPSYSFLGNNIIFTRRSGGVNEDFYISSRDSCGDWSRAHDVGFPLNSQNPEGAQVRSFNEKYMIYQKCDNRSPNGWEMGGCDLYLSYATANGWSTPRSFGYTINTIAFEGMPALAPDESALYFVSDRPGGYGGKDIWVSYFKNGYWQVPENLGPNVNTDKDEMSPVIAADNKTLFFSSNGHTGFGGFDMYEAIRQADGKWTKAINLGTPLNSNYDDLCGTVAIEGKEMYFASNRTGGFGGLDIYKAELPQNLRPMPMGILYGQVKDHETASPLTRATVTITDLEQDKLLYNLKSNRGDGSFYATLPSGKRYGIKVESNYYKPFEEHVSLSALSIIDTVKCALLPEGYVPNKKNLALLTIDMKDTFMRGQDSFCLAISRALNPYSGKIVGLEMNSYVLVTDTGLLYDYSGLLKECLYKIGITDEYLINNVWEIQQSKADPADKAQEPGIVSFTLEYIE